MFGTSAHPKDVAFSILAVSFPRSVFTSTSPSHAPSHLTDPIKETLQSFDSVLIVGGCGFLGHHVVHALLDRCTRISVLDLQATKNRFPGVSYYDGDISSVLDVATVLKKARPTTIIHTASPTATLDDLALFTRVNIEGTRILLSAAQTLGVRVFVYTSSPSVAHNGISNLTLGTETLPILPRPHQPDPYAYTKGVAETLVLAASGRDMLTAAIRPAGIFGEGDAGATTNMITSAKAGKFKVQIGDGTNLFDWTYVGSVAAAYLLAAQALLSTDAAVRAAVAAEAFLVTNDEPMRFWDFARALGAAAGYPTAAGAVWMMPRSVGIFMGWVSELVVWAVSWGTRQPVMTARGIRYSCVTRTFDIGKAKARLGYTVDVSMKEGIRRAGEWFLREYETKKTM
ncbi:erg26, C-3 sterol dehydrogenase [Xylographa trunciseda]|nr:erg26, C-3 sterol dehydrogenase [Xylographa trunciseda]